MRSPRPNPGLKRGLFVDAYRNSSIDPRQVGYIEAHGTGTVLGTLWKVEGIKEAFRTLYRNRGLDLPRDKAVSIGSAKTSIGHLESFAGVSGLIKAILMLRHRTLPPLVHLKELNPGLDVEDTPFLFPQRFAGLAGT